MIVRATPPRPIGPGSAAFKKTISPIREKITSIDWVASTAAISSGRLHRYLAYRKMVVATTPESSATSAVLIHCPGVGGGGFVQSRRMIQNGTEPIVSSST